MIIDEISYEEGAELIKQFYAGMANEHDNYLQEFDGRQFEGMRMPSNVYKPGESSAKRT